MPRDLDLTFDISTGALTLDRVVGNYVKRSETLTLSVTIVSNGASATIPSGLVGTLKPVNTYGTTLAQWTTFAQVGATNVYTASTTINAAAVTTLLGTTTEQANCVLDFAGAGVVESDTLALVLKNNVTRDDDTAPTALLNRNDFLVSNGTGLLVNVAAGYAANGAFVAAQASLAITNATNYIEVTAAGVASVNTTAFTAGSYPLATVVASAGAITSNTDLRAWITPKPAAAGGVISITGTANEITVTGTTTPTLSLPSALTFTAKTITGGTFASPTFTTPTIGDGTEAAPSLSFTSDTNTGVYRPAADTVGIVGGGHDILRLTDVASATDYLEVKNGIGVGSPLHVLAEGASANIGVHLQPKGSGLFTISDGTDFNTGIRFRSSSSAASAITLLDAVSTAGRVITLPDATGTLATLAGTETLTNKRLTQRTGTATSSATPTINTDNVDRYDLTAQAEAITSFTTNLSGTPTNGQALWISVKGTAARAITWGASFESGAATLPTTTVSTDRLDVLFVWNAVTSKWRCVLTPASDATKLPLAGGTMDENAIVNLFNGSKWQQSTPDKGIAGTAGFSVICSVGYEYKFALGYLFILSDNSTTVRKVLYAPATPTVSDDTTLGYTTDTTWETADGTQYHCTDVTEGAAVWAVVPAFNPAAPGPLGDTTADVVNTTELKVRDSGGTVTASIEGSGGSASFASGALTIDSVGTLTAPYLNVTSGGYGTTQIEGVGTLTMWSNVNGVKWLKLDSDDDSVKLYNSAGGYSDPPTITFTSSNGSASFVGAIGVANNGTTIGNDFDTSGNVRVGSNFVGGGYLILRNDGSARFANGDCTIGTDGSIIYGAASAGYLNGDGSASFSYGYATIDTDGTLTLAGALIGGTQSLTTAGGAGAVNLTTLTTEVETTGTLDALTLANGTAGQIKVITHTVGAFTSVLTPTTALGFSTITFLASLGQTCTLEYTTAGWVILAVGGLTLPVVA